MWQRFTERARRVVFFAQEEANKLGENYVSTEHLLLGLVREEDSSAVRMLRAMDVDPENVRDEAKKQVKEGDGKLGGDMQLTPRAKRVIDLAYDEARNMQHDYIGTEHLLLGLVREGEGLAGRILTKLGADLEKTRDAVVRVLGITPKPDQSAVPVKGDELIESTEIGAGLKGKNLIEIAALNLVQINAIFNMTSRLKKMPPDQQRNMLEGKTLAMIFEKPSLRTRVSFETGTFQLGGHAIYMAPSDIDLGARESVADIARTLGRMSDIIMARTFAHEHVETIAEHAGVPVINGLSDLEHPCQALADFYTILQHKGKLGGLKLAFIGDGNNVAHSLMLLAAKVGTHFAIGCPKGYEPNARTVKVARAFAKESGAKIQILLDPKKAVSQADIVYTDVWASMGQESEAKQRAKAFADYQVNAELMKLAKKDAIFEHCLPAHRGQEVTDEVIDSAQSVVFDEAENRLHVQKAVMVLLAG